MTALSFRALLKGDGLVEFTIASQSDLLVPPPKEEDVFGDAIPSGDLLLDEKLAAKRLDSLRPLFFLVGSFELESLAFECLEELSSRSTFFSNGCFE